MAAAGDGIITHRNVEVNGVRLHVAEAGPAGAPVALLLHGFPELWYTWRHQMPALAAAGYRAVAPDLRGYGDSDAPAGGPSKYTALHVVGDLVALIDSLGQEQVFVVAHDWGALIAWYMCLFRPDKVRALVAMSVAFFPRDPAQTLVEAFRSLYGDEYYVCRFQEAGEMEAEFARLGTELVLRKILAYRTAEPLLIPKSGWGSPNDKIPLPSWISDEDIKYYTSQFEKTGFTGGLNYYRALDRIKSTLGWDEPEVVIGMDGWYDVGLDSKVHALLIPISCDDDWDTYKEIVLVSQVRSLEVVVERTIVGENMRKNVDAVNGAIEKVESVVELSQGLPMEEQPSQVVIGIKGVASPWPGLETT